jgi:hypothetical protein
MHWGKNQKGMQADEELNCTVDLGLLPGDYDITGREEAWLTARNHAVIIAGQMAKAGYHKQIVNRLLEPFSHITTLVTATEFSNWFNLRLHPDAQPEIQVLADEMFHALSASIPQTMLPGEWHLPYITADDVVGVMKDMMEVDDNWGVVADEDLKLQLAKISAARCARVSYLNYEGKVPTVDEDLALYSRLMSEQPLHASPTEHQATPDVWAVAWGQNCWEKPELHGNFFGWVQFRKTIKGEDGGTRRVLP